MVSTIITDYLGQGTSGTRPTSAPVASGALAIQYATDTNALALWNGSAYVPFAGGGVIVQSGGSVIGSAGTLNLVGAGVASSGGTATITVPQGGVIVSGGSTIVSGATEIAFTNATLVGSGGTALVTPQITVQSGGTVLGNISGTNFTGSLGVTSSGGIVTVKDLSSTPSYNYVINNSGTSVSASVTLSPTAQTRYLIISNSSASQYRNAYTLTASVGTLEVTNANWAAQNNGDGTLFATLLMSSGTSCTLTATTTQTSSGYINVSILAIPLPA